jgi:hypothetical protein
LSIPLMGLSMSFLVQIHTKAVPTKKIQLNQLIKLHQSWVAKF